MTEHVFVDLYSQEQSLSDIARYTIHMKIADPVDGGGLSQYVDTVIFDNLKNSIIQTSEMANEDFEMINYGLKVQNIILCIIWKKSVNL